MLPADFAVQRIHAHGFGVGLGRAAALTVAEHPQPADAQGLPVGECAARHADIPRADAVRVFIIAVGAFAGDVLAQGPYLAVQAGFNSVMRNLRAGFDVAGLAVIAVAVGGEVHRQRFVRHIDLNRPHIAVPAQIHAEPFAGLVAARAPPAAAVLVHGVGRVAALGGGGCRHGLAVAEQHPFGGLRGGVKFACRDFMRIIGKILVAVQYAVLVKPGREQAHAALKVVVDRNAHRGRVPVVAVFVGNRAAVSGTRHKPTRLGGKRVGRLQRERSQRGLGGVHTIGVGVVLCAGAGVLQIIHTVVLCHKRALDIGLADGVEHGGQHFGVQPRYLRHLGRQLQLTGCLVIERLHGFVKHAGLFIHNAVVAGALIAQFVFTTEDQFFLFSDGRHRFGVKLHAPDGRHVGAAPVEIHAAIIVTEHVGIPEVERRADLGKRLGQRVGSAQNRAVTPLAAGRKIEILADLTHIGCVVVNQQIGVGVEIPVQQIVRIPEPRRHRNKQVVFTLEVHQRRVGALAEACDALTLFHVLVAVAQIQGVAVSFHRITHPF